MPRAAQARIFRTTGTGTVRTLTTTYGTASVNAQAAFAAAGASGYRWNPNATAAAADPPTSGTAAAGIGWRDTTGESTTDPVTYAIGTWTVRALINKNVMTINASVTVRVTAIVYQVSSAGTHVAEIGRVVFADTALPTVGVEVALSGSFTTSSATVFSTGDKVQAECYVQNIVATLPAATATAYTVSFVQDQTSAASGSAFTAIPTYTTQFSNTSPTTVTGTAAMARALTLFKTLTRTVTGTAARILRVNPLAKTSTATGTTARTLSVAPLAKTATVTGTTARKLAVTPIPKTATVTGTAVTVKALTLFRTFAVTATGTTSRGLSVTRTFAATITGTATFARTLSLVRTFAATVTGQTARVLRVSRTFTATVTGTAVMSRTVTLFRTLAATVTGTAAQIKALIFARTVSTTTTGTASGRVDIPITALNRIIPAAAPDWPLNTPTKAIAGVTRNAAGAVVTSATVKLVRQSDDVRVATVTSNATTGAYSFTRGGDDPNSYFVLAYRADTPEVHGVSDRGLVPA